MTPLDSNSTATVDTATGDFTLTSTSRTLVYLTGFGIQAYPCPRRINGMCDGGARQGRSCTVSTSVEQTSLDCPPSDSTFFLALGAGPSSASTQPKMLAAADGLFCPAQLHPGAFGLPAARRIELDGIAAANLHDHQPHLTTLLDLFWVPSTGNAAVDNLADYPGPEAQSIAGTIELTE